MDPQEKFVMYLQNNPQFNSISQSELFMKIISELNKKAHPFIELRELFPAIEEKDMQTILDALESVQIIKKTKVNWNTYVYYTTQEAKNLLEHYKNAKKHFDLD
ncbi:MAG: hypothetical protein V1672_02070 [Candidatus Diapherotrites archaeon]